MRIYPFPNEYEKRSEEYTVECMSESIPVYSCDVSAVPFNQVWPGYQRPKTQTEESAFIMLASDSGITLDIKPKQQFKKAVVRPLSKGITPQIKGNGVSVTFPGAGQYTVEFDNEDRVLTVFINSEKKFDVDKESENVIYFGRGVHRLDGRIVLKDGQTVFIDEGAVVYGAIEASDKKNIRIIGCGVLDNSNMQRANEINGCAVLDPNAGKMTGNPIFLNRCENVIIDGITIVNSSGWNIYLDGCVDVVVDNIKLIGMWRYNADGCDFCNCRNAIIKNSFLRTFDDGIVVKGFRLNGDLPVENIKAENCVLWCDWGRAFEIGTETCAPYIREITFKNCDIISGCHAMMGVQHGGKAEIDDVSYEDICVEYRTKAKAPLIQESADSEYANENENYMPMLFGVKAGMLSNVFSIDTKLGSLKNVSFKNITVITDDGRIPYDSQIIVEDGEDRIDGVYFENILVNGKKVDAETLGLKIGAGAKGIVWKK